MVDNRENIEREAVAAAAMYPNQRVRYYPRPCFRFDLNDMGRIYTPIDPVSVLKLVEIMRKYDDSEYGHHSAILNQMACRSAFGGDLIDWQRVQYAGREPEWVSLRDWLRENGCPYMPPNIRKAFDEWERGNRYLGDEDGGSSDLMDVCHSARKFLDLVKEGSEPLSAFVPDETVRQSIEAHAAEYDEAEELEQRAYAAMDPAPRD